MFYITCEPTRCSWSGGPRALFYGMGGCMFHITCETTYWLYMVGS
jgi:hypothetical protein